MSLDKLKTSRTSLGSLKAVLIISKTISNRQLCKTKRVGDILAQTVDRTFDLEREVSVQVLEPHSLIQNLLEVVQAGNAHELLSQVSELRFLMKDLLEVGREGKAHETSLRQVANHIENMEPTLEQQSYSELLQEKRDYIIDNQQCAPHACVLLACCAYMHACKCNAARKRESNHQ